MGQVRKTVGQILLEKGVINQEQYNNAAQVQRQTNQPWDAVLVDLALAAPKQVAEAKAAQIGVPYLDLSKVAPSQDAINLVKGHICRRHNAVPIRRADNRLMVAMQNPNDVTAIDDIAAVSGLQVVPALATAEDIEDALRRTYRDESDDIQSAVGAFQSMNSAMLGDDDDEAVVQTGGGEDDAKDSAPVIRIAQTMIQQAIKDGASDIHVEPGRRDVRIRFRIDGVLHEMMRVPKYIAAPLVSRLKIMSELNIAERRLPQDGRIPVRTKEGKDYDLRVSVLPNINGEKVVMRILDKSSIMIGLNKLGFLPDTQAQLETLIVQPNGMLLSTGPTGSGKTTTQYSVLNKINSVDVNIITIEDPVEYELPGITQVHVNRKAGLTFAAALRSFLRQDPDIIMVGEIRDLETAEIAIQASLTGHLVLSTLHTNDAPSAFTRLTDMGVEPFLSAASLIGILAQRLARRICQNCKTQYHPPVDALKRIGFKLEEGAPPPTFYKGQGCEACRQTGYKGRTGIHELMMVNEEIQELAARRAPLGDLREAARANGMRTLKEDALLKVLAAQTTLEEALRVVFTAGGG